MLCWAPVVGCAHGRSAVRKMAGGRGMCSLWVRGVVVGGWGLAFGRCGDRERVMRNYLQGLYT
jgi:hypothetical protein